MLGLGNSRRWLEFLLGEGLGCASPELSFALGSVLSFLFVFPAGNFVFTFRLEFGSNGMLTFDSVGVGGAFGVMFCSPAPVGVCAGCTGWLPGSTPSG